MHVTCIHAAERAPLFLICPMVCLFDVGAGRKLSAPMKSKRDGRRSRCPISFALDSLGDKWTLLVLRDLILFGKKHYGEFSQSEEKIASNILADRLKRLDELGFITKRADPDNQTKNIYRPTDKALDLVPLIFEIVLWSAKYDPKTAAPKEFVNRLKKNRQAMIKEIMARWGKRTA